MLENTNYSLHGVTNLIKKQTLMLENTTYYISYSHPIQQLPGSLMGISV